MKFYGRVQVILGVFMMFHLSMTILKGIVNPDSFTGDKGGRALIVKVFTALTLLVVLMPIPIPNPPPIPIPNPTNTIIIEFIIIAM